MSKISDYQFEQQVRDLQQQGKSIRKIAEILNKQIPTDDEPISEMAVSRWIRADKKQLPMIKVKSDSSSADIADTLTSTGVQASEDVNPYEETIKLINDCDYQIEILKKRIEKEALITVGDNKKNGNADPQGLLAQYISRKQSLLNDIASYQKDLSNYAKVKETLKIVYDVLKEVSPESYEQFKKEVRDRQGLTNMLKS